MTAHGTHHIAALLEGQLGQADARHADLLWEADLVHLYMPMSASYTECLHAISCLSSCDLSSDVSFIGLMAAYDGDSWLDTAARSTRAALLSRLGEHMK